MMRSKIRTANIAKTKTLGTGSNTNTKIKSYIVLYSKKKK